MTEPKRVNVAANAAMIAAIERMTEQEQVTLTEAVNKLLGYGEFVYRTVREDGCTLTILKSDGTRVSVILI
jgi:hypothetical protein